MSFAVLQALGFLVLSRGVVHAGHAESAERGGATEDGGRGRGDGHGAVRRRVDLQRPINVQILPVRRDSGLIQPYTYRMHRYCTPTPQNYQSICNSVSQSGNDGTDNEIKITLQV